MELKCDFNNFQTMLIRLMTNAIDEPENYRCMLVMNSDSTASLHFIQILEYRSVDLLTLKLTLGDEDEINRHVSFRYKYVAY